MDFYSYNKIKNTDKMIYLILDFICAIISICAYIYLAYNVFTNIIGLKGTIWYFSIFTLLPFIVAILINKMVDNEILKHIILCGIKIFTSIIGTLVFIYIIQAYVPISHKILYNIFIVFSILDIITYMIKFEQVEQFFNQIIGTITMLILTYIAYSIIPLNTFLITCFLLYFPKLLTTQNNKD